uniref:Cell division cycle associated 5 n=1 Tax=Callithrix jacchus TaxID=9483 RepID=A0A5F4W7E4_CALJA
MPGRRTRSGGAAQRSGPRAPSPVKSVRRSQRKSGSDLPSIPPEIWPKTPSAAAIRKPIVLKKIVAHAVEVPAVHSPRRSPRIAFFLEKENKPPCRELTKEDLSKIHSVPDTPNTSPVLNPEAESSSKERELDARDLEMFKKVRRSYSRLETLGSTSTSTPGRRSCFGFEGLLGAEDLSGVSPVVCSKFIEVPRVGAKPWAPDTTLPGISPPPEKQKRKKKKMPEILVSERGFFSAVCSGRCAGLGLWLFWGISSTCRVWVSCSSHCVPFSLICSPLFLQKTELDEWAAAMNAEFEAAEQFDLLVE